VWQGFIKDYDGGTLMQCTMLPKVDYMRVYHMLNEQKTELLERLKLMDNAKTFKALDGIIFFSPGLEFQNMTDPR
jgi:histone acetyltransferase